MGTQTVFVASNPGEALQPIPFVSSSSLGYTNTVSAGLWSTGASATGTGELPVAELGLGFARMRGALNPVPEIIQYGGKVLFDANSGAWVSDGTPLGTYQIAPNVFFGFYYYSNQTATLQYPDFVAFDGKVMFVGTGTTGLYVTDGTAAGTHQLVTQSAVPNTGVAPTNLTVLGTEALFSGHVGDNARALWSSDGVANTSVLLSATGQQVTNPSDLTVFGSNVLFDADDGAGGNGLWITDGTAAGTTQIAVAGAAASGSFEHGLSPVRFAAIGTQAVFSGNDATLHTGLWRTDGTAAGTYELNVAGVSASGFDPERITSIGTRAVFDASGADNTNSVWITDGTAAGTTELVSGMFGSAFAATARGAVFTASSNGSLYTTDGTAVGTGVLSVPGASATGFSAALISTDGASATFTGLDANGTLGLWTTDGTTAGTREILAGLPQVAVGPVDFASVTTPPLYLTTLQTPGFFGTGTLARGMTLQIVLGTNQAVTVDTSGGQPTLALSNGAATYSPALSTPTQTVFTYVVAPGGDTSDLRINALALNGARITDAAGDAIAATSLTGFSTSDAGIQVSSTYNFIPPRGATTATPVISRPGGGLLTNLPSATLGGTAVPGASIALFDAGAAAGTATADATTGAWQAAVTLVGLGVQPVTAVATAGGLAPSLPSASVPVFALAAPVNGVSSADVASVDVASVLGTGFGLQFAGGTEAVQLLDGTLSVGPDTDAAYVGRLYVGLFGVVPDSANLSIWTNYMAAGHSQTDVAAGFLAAPASASLAALPDGQFVQQVFTSFLGHGPTPDQAVAFGGVLAAGASRASVLAGIADSPESKAALAPQTARLFATDTATQTVNDVFRAGLGHDATQPVVQSLGGSLQAGLTAVQLAQEIAGTPEFLGLHGGQSDASYVASVYTAGLGRAPSGTELGSVVGGLQAGVFDRATVLAAVATSPEGIAHLTQPL